MSGTPGPQCSWIPRAVSCAVTFTDRSSRVARLSIFGLMCAEIRGSRICFQKQRVPARQQVGRESDVCPEPRGVSVEGLMWAGRDLCLVESEVSFHSPGSVLQAPCAPRFLVHPSPHPNLSLCYQQQSMSPFNFSPHLLPSSEFPCDSTGPLDNLDSIVHL